MLLHAKHASQSAENIIYTPDTDVLVNALAASGEVESRLFIRTGTKAHSRLISIEQSKSSLASLYNLNDTDMAVLAMVISSLHAFWL